MAGRKEASGVSEESEAINEEAEVVNTKERERAFSKENGGVNGKQEPVDEWSEVVNGDARAVNAAILAANEEVEVCNIATCSPITNSKGSNDGNVRDGSTQFPSSEDRDLFSSVPTSSSSSASLAPEEPEDAGHETQEVEHSTVPKNDD